MSGTAVLFQRTEVDFWNAFEVQKSALEISSLAFDGGMIGEAARLATAAFLLVGPSTRNHTSIFDHLGIKDNMEFQTTVPDGNQSGTPLVHCNLELVRKNPTTGNDEFVIELQPRGRQAMLTGRKLKCDEWWNETVLKDEKRQLTRDNIIRILRDKAGGAHYDAKVTDPLIAAALRGEITGFMYKNESGKALPVPFVLENTMRQIAEELRGVVRYLRPRYDPLFKSSG
jgi:hypothetical protein